MIFTLFIYSEVGKYILLKIGREYNYEKKTIEM